MTLRCATTLAAFFLVAVSACGVSPTGTSQDGVSSEPPAPDGVGPTVGGCPAAEPRAGTACTVRGRLCKWTQSCGAVDTGWCTAGGTWRVATGTCKAGCPAEPTVSQGIGGAPMNVDGGEPGPTSVGPSCTSGLTCTYPSTPLGGGESCSCNGGQWNSLCSSLDDGWVPAPSRATGECKELAPCGGQSGCGDSCPSAAPRECGCGPDGLMYCQIKESCGGGTTTATGTGTANGT
jgi:hypothetical protein